MLSFTHQFQKQRIHLSADCRYYLFSYSLSNNLSSLAQFMYDKHAIYSSNSLEEAAVRSNYLFIYDIDIFIIVTYSEHSVLYESIPPDPHPQERIGRPSVDQRLYKGCSSLTQHPNSAKRRVFFFKKVDNFYMIVGLEQSRINWKMVVVKNYSDIKSSLTVLICLKDLPPCILML